MTDDITIHEYPCYDICADDTFDSAHANRRFGFAYPNTLEEQIHRPLSVAGQIGAYMAGMHCPSATRMTALVHNITDIHEWEKHAVRELFAQLAPVECMEFMITTDSSPREVARLLRTSGVRRPLVVNWINQFSSDPTWRQDTMLEIQHGEREAALRAALTPRRT